MKFLKYGFKGLIIVLLSLALIPIDASVDQKKQTYLDEQLMQAAVDGNLIKITDLLKAGANVNAKDRYGVSPVIAIMRKGLSHRLPRAWAAGARPRRWTGRVPTGR